MCLLKAKKRKFSLKICVFLLTGFLTKIFESKLINVVIFIIVIFVNYFLTQIISN